MKAKYKGRTFDVVDCEGPYLFMIEEGKEKALKVAMDAPGLQVEPEMEKKNGEHS